MYISPKRKRQVIGMCAGVLLSVVAYVVLLIPSNEDLVSLGPMNTGHEELQCIDCHTKAPGTALQQIQANFMHMIGARNNDVEFGHLDVDTKKCQGCHDRPNDRHPVHRFQETRFADARKNIEVTQCETCHLEHQGVRLTIAVNEATYCKNCHEDLDMKNDPLDVPHAQLIKEEKWSTCLQCHDFHGNHFMKTAEHMKDTVSIEALKAYFEGGESPYSDRKKYIAKKKPEDKLIENKKEEKPKAKEYTEEKQNY